LSKDFLSLVCKWFKGIELRGNVKVWWSIIVDRTIMFLLLKTFSLYLSGLIKSLSWFSLSWVLFLLIFYNLITVLIFITLVLFVVYLRVYINSRSLRSNKLSMCSCSLRIIHRILLTWKHIKIIISIIKIQFHIFSL
jgi:hypothetical protein